MEYILDEESISEQEFFENRLTEKQIAGKRKRQLVFGAILKGMLWIAGEGLIVFLGIQIQKIDAYIIAFGDGWNYCNVEYGFNHLFYTLGLLFFVVMSLALYYGAFDNSVRKYLYKGRGYAAILLFSGAIGAAVTYILGEVLLRRYNIYRSQVGSYRYGPESMFYLTHIGWPLFVILLITAQTLKNVIFAGIEKKKSAGQV